MPAVSEPTPSARSSSDGGANAPGTTAGLFRQRNFPALWWGQLVSLTGERATYLALIALLAQHTHGLQDAHAAWLLSMLANVMLAPVLLFAPFAGAWIDRRNLRHLVVTCDVLRGLIVLAISLVYPLWGRVEPVFALLFLLFTCGVFFLPAKSSLTPELVAESQLLAANTWLTVAGIIAAGVGTLGGGWLVDHVGWTVALELNAATYFASAATLAWVRYVPRVRPRAAAGPGVSGYLLQLREGWAVVRDNAAVGLALTALGVLWWSGGFLHVAGNLHVQRAASVPGVERLGVLFATLAIGGGASAVCVNRLGAAIPRVRLIATAVLFAGVGLLVFASTTQFTVMLLGAFIMGIAAAPIILVGETLLQSSTEPGMRARVFAARDFAMRLTLLASVSAAAWLSRVAGAQLTIALCGALVIAAGALAVLSRRGARATPRPDPLPLPPPPPPRSRPW